MVLVSGTDLEDEAKSLFLEYKSWESMGIGSSISSRFFLIGRIRRFSDLQILLSSSTDFRSFPAESGPYALI